MWRCPRCGARNNREVDHCGECGMPNPIGDGGTTKTMDIPPAAARPAPPERSRSLPWLAIIAAVIVLLAIVLVAVAALSG